MWLRLWSSIDFDYFIDQKIDLSVWSLMIYKYSLAITIPKLLQLESGDFKIFKGVLGVRFFFYILFYALMLCVYVSRTRFRSRAIKDVYIEIYLFLYDEFMPLSNLFHFASRRFFSAFSPVGGDDRYFQVPLYCIKM